MTYANLGDRPHLSTCLCNACIDARPPLPEGPALNVRRSIIVRQCPVSLGACRVCSAWRCEKIPEDAVATPTKPALPTDRAARKATPIYSGFIKYFPDAMAAVAQLSHSANEVHNPGEPLHWSKDKSNDHPDCMARHLTELEDYDSEADHDYHYLHAVKNAWRAMAFLQTVLDTGKAGRVKKGELP